MPVFSPIERLKKVLAWFWTIVIVALLVFVAFNPHLLSVEYMSEQLSKYESQIWWIYLGLMLGRGLLMLPSTPFLFLGFALFPEYKLLVVFITLGSVLFSASFFYYFSHRMGWHLYFERKFPRQMEKIELRLQKPGAIFIVMFWSFVPITPTDLICYVAGVVRMPFRYVFIGVLIGQLPLMLFYAYLGSFFF